MMFPVIPWRLVGGLLVRHWRLVVLAAFALFALSWHLRGERIEELEREAEAWDSAVRTLQRALDRNREDLLECAAVNAANAADLAFVEGQLDAAELEILMLEHRAANEQERWQREETEIRGRADTTCRTLADPLPEWLVAGLRRPTP